ncbi:MAG TPA: Na+/H+ antiporter NhaA [Candidatus Hydrogenedentes bacterium]|nr:Na+/H+ antiporter NhaA [Candidatus Hydrogenedentota bacterium]HRK33886.1 Na+/H+ antiporter NhaA [Candidatus Hydrogenedentota bacterium]
MMQETNAPGAAEPELEEQTLIERIMAWDLVSAVFLLASAATALILANSPWQEWYHNVWHTYHGIAFGGFEVKQSAHHWINDGLMAIFFFVVGLEIKRELLVGELATLRRALLPAVAAIGGMVTPALVYAAVNWGEPSVRGWGIPMATDIAFATGCLALLGKRILPSMSIFLVALAIVDDLGSVAVIAIFYTQQIDTQPLFTGAFLIIISFGLNMLGVRRTWPYALIGIIVWWAFLESGVHATIAGVLLAFTIPATARYETPKFQVRMRTLLSRFVAAEDYAHAYQVNHRQQELIRHMVRECQHVEAPLQRIEHTLYPLCVLFILPLFAFANSGVTLALGDFGSLLTERVTLGVIFGLLIGKQIGITGAAWIAVKLGLADLPAGMTWRHVYGLSWIAAIGFTMALFISELAFAAGTGDGPRHIAEAKIGIFIASISAGVIGLLILRGAKAPSQATG